MVLVERCYWEREMVLGERERWCWESDGVGRVMVLGERWCW